MWSVFPESLLAYADWKQWTRDNSGRAGSHFHPNSEEEFEVFSKQAWTHLLMQIVKVCGNFCVHMTESVSSFVMAGSNVYIDRVAC